MTLGTTPDTMLGDCYLVICLPRHDGDVGCQPGSSTVLRSQTKGIEVGVGVKHIQVLGTLQAVDHEIG